MSRWRRGFVTSVLFPSPPSSYTIDSFPGELVWVPGACNWPDAKAAKSGTRAASVGAAHRPDETVPCLLLLFESARFLLIFFHSNAEDLGRCRWFCHFLRDQFQVHVLAVEYPGYGVCPGSATREGVLANAHAALQFATQGLRLPLDQIKVFGRSIGTGPALALASRFKLAGLILVTPFVSIQALFRDRVGPLSLLVEEWFENGDAMKEVQSPTMIIHGRADMIIPYHHSEELYRACPARKLLINPAGMEHNTNLTSDVSFLILPMFRFFSLPDYSFEDLEVPSWAFDKRRSPLYEQPEVNSCGAVEAAINGTFPGTGFTCAPEGDDEPIDQEASFIGAPAWGSNADHQSLPVPEGAQDFVVPAAHQTVSAKMLIVGPARAAATAAAAGSPAGAGSNADASESPAVLTHPTVRHAYSATKRRYDFGRCGAALVVKAPGGAGEEVAVDAAGALRRNSLGHRTSATRVPQHDHSHRSAGGRSFDGAMSQARGVDEPFPRQEKAAHERGMTPPTPQLYLKGASVGMGAKALAGIRKAPRPRLGSPVLPLLGDTTAAEIEDPFAIGMWSTLAAGKAIAMGRRPPPLRASVDEPVVEPPDWCLDVPNDEPSFGSIPTMPETQTLRQSSDSE